MANNTSVLHRRALERAAAVLGGKQRLQEYLRVPSRKVDAWLEAMEPVPMAVFLKAVDLITRPPESPVAALGRIREASSQPDAMLGAALESAVHASAADMGNIQIAGADGLRIVAQRGFERPFLDFFALVADDTSACGRAIKAGRRVVVGDVAHDAVFAGTDAGLVMEAARARAVQSTPIVAASGWILGVISTHYERPYEPTPEELAAVDDIARHAAFLLESARA
jgi:GAF domain-containing protein